MVKINTRHFGGIEIGDDKIISFDRGLPGFPDYHRFALIADPTDLERSEAVFYWLQSLDDPDIAFTLITLAELLKDYNPLVDETEMDGMGPFDDEHYLVFNMAVIPENVNETTVNLKAPVIIDSRTNQGRQVICQNEDYNIRHYLFK